ncbi:L-threonylcarbamoyladenylate synthase [Microterricola pindariensis]|uniref:L-threonylcarbamoyladenylate synthase n=1 Tax=Microterricola pindariensis TaxID=478010 RepID=A0ABX5AVX1_9MICO|nr:L-threonylcarbamoyladenylate synthase [Microterricola pindariensis]PPL18806.1 threonylcarbamoyl-AMP synthase [Microterricola pindariensis]
MAPRIFDCSVDTELMSGMRLARSAIGRGALVVMPTDTVYGIAADAFNPAAVQRLLEAKGRERSSPPPVLIPGIATLDALAAEVPQAVRDLIDAFWPGGLTVILRAQPSLSWDLGETRGTVALRMPANPLALELLSETGPLAVSSANRTGMPAATGAAQAEDMLGESVEVYLDGGESGADYEAIGERAGDLSSTIIDATTLGQPGGALRIVRAGVISREQIRAIVGDLLAGPDAAVPQPAAATDAAATDAAATDTAAPESATEPAEPDA